MKPEKTSEICETPQNHSESEETDGNILGIKSQKSGSHSSEGCGKEVHAQEGEDGTAILWCCGEYATRRATGKRELLLCSDCKKSEESCLSDKEKQSEICEMI